MGLTQTIPPAAEPIDVEEAKDHLHEVDATNDTYVTACIAAATRRAEVFLGRQLVAATWKLTLDAWPAHDVFRVPRAPLISVTSLTYVDTGGTTQTLTEGTDFDVDTDSEPGRILPCYGESWPSLRDHIDVVTLTYVAGYATPFTADLSTDILTWLGRSPTDADSYVLQNSGGALPGGLSANTLYHVRDATGATCKLAASAGGAVIDITDAGTGTHFTGAVPENIRAAILLDLGVLYAFREDVITGTIVTKLPDGAKSLLWASRIAEAG